MDLFCPEHLEERALGYARFQPYLGLKCLRVDLDFETVSRIDCMGTSRLQQHQSHRNQ